MKLSAKFIFLAATFCFILGGAVMFKLLPIEFPFGSLGLVFMALGLYSNSKSSKNTTRELSMALEEAQEIIEEWKRLRQ